MDERFYKSKYLNKEVLGKLLVRNDRLALERFILQYSLFLVSAVVVIANPHPGLGMAMALIIFALMTMAMFALVHETGHNTAFRSRSLNRLVCWLAGTPIYYTPTIFREFHFTHHRHTHEPGKDPEISVGGKAMVGVTDNIGIYIAYLTGLPLVLMKIAFIVAAAIGTPQAIWSHFLVFVSSRARQRSIWEARVVLGFHIIWIAVGILWLPGLLYLLLGQILGHFLLVIYLTGEHNGLPHEGSILERTRTTHAHPLLKWLMWNMPYHAEHHAYPAVPWHTLPHLHQLLAPELRHTEKNHLNFHRRVLAFLLKGQAFQDLKN